MSLEQAFRPRRLQEDFAARTTGRLFGLISVDTDVLKEWIERCNSNHQHVCGRIREDGIRPDRLIDCSRWELCTSDEPYVCLSYVWGSNLSDQKVAGNALPHEMPSTISDAMEVTLKLGWRYLWVDRYCINQDDEHEKHNIIRNMDAIYDGADLTIIAAAGRDPGHGLPGISRTREPQRTFTIANHVFVAVENPAIDIGTSEWNTRAWTSQEALLSRKRLIFTDRQVYFQCRLGLCTEGLTLPGSIESTRHLRAFPERGIVFRTVEIYDRLEEYYGRKLSFDTDVLNAFSGIFRAFERNPFGSTSPYATHFYGIPTIVSPGEPAHNLDKSLAAGLAWRVSSNKGVVMEVPVKNNSDYPSWSWAALKVRRPQTNPGELSLLYRGSSKLPGLDEIAKIHLCHRSGVEISLMDYVKREDDYAAFLPCLHITSIAISGKLLRGRSDLVTFSPCPLMALHLDQDYNSLPCDAIAVYVGYFEETSKVNLAFLLIQLLGNGHCRRLGVLSHRINPYRFDRGPGGNSSYLQIVCGGGAWHEERFILE